LAIKRFSCKTFINLKKETQCEVTQTEAKVWQIQKDVNAEEETKPVTIARHPTSALTNNWAKF
jgi:hypothetical protein